jgi:cytochrome c oxidase assembly protein subunit 11
MSKDAAALSRRNRVVALVAVAAVCGMIGLAYASKPLYDAFCRITGYGGTTRIAEAKASAILDQTIEVRFDANVAQNVPLRFRAQQTSETFKIGETALAFYTVTNTSDKPFTAIANYNVTPHKSGPFFQKLECFCFQNRTFAPGETMELPVVFYVDPAIVEDRDAKDVKTITLSYTFFEAANVDTATLSGEKPNG